MDNKIKEYCKYCRFYGVLGCKSTLICNDGNRFFNPNIANEEQGMTLVYDDESGTWGEAPETYGSIAFDTKEAFEKALDMLKNYKWVSVDEALPSDNKACVVMTKKNGLGVSRLMGRNRIEWTLFGEPVLYWLPIPEPPKDGDTE